MSTREIAVNIFNSLTEKQLEGFVAMFGELYSISDLQENFNADDRMQAFEELDGMIKDIPEFDYDKELADYREEKYGR